MKVRTALCADAGDASGVSNAISRVTSLSTAATRGTADANVLAGYDTLGLSNTIRTTYPQPQVRLDRWGGTSGTYADLDNFNPPPLTLNFHEPPFFSSAP